jgi:four helix bundle protein
MKKSTNPGGCMSCVIRSYRDLEVWKKGVDLAVDLYAVTRRFPSYERFAMVSQIQRAAVSIPSNIAEGHSKSGPGHYLNHLSHALGSLGELETLLLIASRVGHINAETYGVLVARLDTIGRMLHNLIRSLACSSAKGRPDVIEDPGPRTQDRGRRKAAAR